MHSLFELTKVLLVSQFKSMTDPNRTGFSSKKKPSKTSKITLAIAYTILIGYVVLLLSFLFNGIIDMAITYGQTTMPVVMLLIVVLTFVLFMMVFSMISTLYYDKTTSILLPLPLSASTILASRSIVLMVNTIILVVLVTIGPLVMITIKLGLTIVQLILLIVLMLTISIIPSAILGILLMLLMRYSKIFYNKKRVQLVAFLAFFILYFIFISGFGFNSDMLEDTTTMVNVINTMTTTLTSYYPPLNLAINALYSPSLIHGLIHLLMYCGLTIAIVIVYFIVGKTIYLNGLVSSLLDGGKQKKTKVKDKVFQSHKPLFGYVIKELSVIFHSATFTIQLVTPVYLVAVILLVSMAIGVAQSGVDLFSLIDIIRQLDVQHYIDFGLCALMLFITSMDFAAGVMVSKDGANASWMRTIPLSALDQSNGKLIAVILIRLPIILVAMVLSLLFGLVTPLGALSILSILIFHMLLCDIFGLWHDARKPLLDWTSEIQAVKNNTKAIVAMLFNIAVAFIIGALYFMVISLTNIAWISELIFLALSICGCIICLMVQQRVGSHLLDAIH